MRCDEQKNELLKRTRGVSFEQVAVLLAQGRVLDLVDHPNPAKYPGQKMAIVELGGYAYLVPYEQVGEETVLKTVIPSRKATRKYLGAEHEEAES